MLVTITKDSVLIRRAGVPEVQISELDVDKLIAKVYSMQRDRAGTEPEWIMAGGIITDVIIAKHDKEEDIFSYTQGVYDENESYFEFLPNAVLRHASLPNN